ncbi:MAG: hypothetical protein VYD39_02085, partial [Bacteroidota bacterium]|nr:hypothetical protein [Bacteroidota bacterium]
ELLSEEKNGGKQNGAPLTGNGSDPVPSAPLMSSTTEGGSGSVPIATSINQGATDGSDSIPVAQPIGERGSFARVSP